MRQRRPMQNVRAVLIDMGRERDGRVHAVPLVEQVVAAPRHAGSALAASVRRKGRCVACAYDPLFSFFVSVALSQLNIFGEYIFWGILNIFHVEQSMPLSGLVLSQAPAVEPHGDAQ
eukprot:7386047-Prymnesium_polylepis.1